MIEQRWREADIVTGERGFQLCPQMGGREYVLQYREGWPKHISTEIAWSDWKDVKIKGDDDDQLD